jgi:ribonuclease J
MIHRTINRLFSRGAHVIYDPIADVHVSGHASQEEMKMMLELVKPKHLIPVHGELRHLRQHAALAREIGMEDSAIAVVENGTVVEFKDGKMKIGERVPGGYVFVDGSGVGDIGPRVMREREALAKDGFVAVHLTLDGKNGALGREPEIVSKGFVFVRDAEELFEHARRRIREVAKEADRGDLKDKIEKDLSRFFYAETKRRPMVMVFTSSR